MDFNNAIRFLNSFNYNKLTLSYFKKGIPCGVDVLDSSQVLQTFPIISKKLYEDKKEVFFMVNEGDGVVHKGKKTPRSQASVSILKSLFIDTDSCPVELVSKFIKSTGVKPHWIIQSSPKKYHIYFLINPTLPTPDNLIKWKSCQTALAYLGDITCKATGCDLAMKDHSRVLRVPDFQHLKKDPVTVKVVGENDAPLFDLETLYNIFNGQAFRQHVGKGKYELPTEKIGKGTRHDELVSFVASMLSNGVPADMIEGITYSHITTHFNNYQDFLPNGKDNNEVKNVIQWKLNSIEQESHAEIREALTRDYEGSNKPADPFALPDDFYFSCPGPIGQIVKEISGAGNYRSVPAIFAHTVASVSALKSSFTVGSYGPDKISVYPSVYFICLAPSGSGKGLSQKILSNTFSHLGKEKMVENQLRSASGLYAFLQDCDSCGLLCIDEAKTIFASIYDNNSSTYLKDLRPALLQLYTQCGHELVSPGRVISKANDLKLSYPHLNIVSFGTPDLLDDAFGFKSLHDGFLQRFLILTDNNPRVSHDIKSALSKLEGSSLEYLAGIVADDAASRIGSILEIDDLKAALDGAETSKERAAIQSQIDDLSSERSPRHKVITFSEEAFRELEGFREWLDKQCQIEREKDSDLDLLYVRAHEQCLRVCVAIATDEVRKDLADYVIRFIKSRIHALREHCSETFKATKRYKEGKEVKKKIEQHFLKNKRAMTFRNLYKSMKKSKGELQPLIDDLISSGEISTTIIVNQGAKNSEAFVPTSDTDLE